MAIHAMTLAHKRRSTWRCVAILALVLCACGKNASDQAEQASSLAGTPASTIPTAGNAGMMIASPLAGTQAGAGTGATAGAAGSVVTPQAGAGAVAGMPGTGGVSGAPSGGVTFHKDIRPILEARCLGCHVDGGSGPFPLDGWDKVDPLKSAVVNAVKIRRMPPWLADSTHCTKTRHDQRLTDGQLSLFMEWETSGYPVGNEADFVPIGEEPQRDIGEPNLIIKARSPFQLTPGREGYHCLQVDTDITEDTWVTAMDMVPEHAEYVHHAIVSVGRGTCSALGTTAENIYSYRPGSRTLIFEEGDALLLPAGGVIAIQFHYNTKFAPAGAALPTDHSAYRLWTLPPGQQPERVIARMPHHDLFITIPVNAVDQKEGGTTSISSEYARAGAEIIGISPHMHYLGQTFKETLHLADGTDVCLVDIPAWDQDWQLDYFYSPEDYIPVSRGARLTQECVYSNRPEDQGSDPEGVPFTPIRTTFGEDTRQEMCLGYIWFRYPLSSAP